VAAKEIAKYGSKEEAELLQMDRASLNSVEILLTVVQLHEKSHLLEKASST